MAHPRALAAAAISAVLVTVLAPRAAPAPPCNAFEVEYALAANLQLADTPLGKATAFIASARAR